MCASVCACVRVCVYVRECFPRRDHICKIKIIKEKKRLPLTPPSEGLAAHFSSPGTVLVSSRVTKMHTDTHTHRWYEEKQAYII